MARNFEFYKGRRKKRNYALIPFAIILGISALLLAAFYGTQKYAVITKDGVNVELPGMAEEENTVIDSQGNEVKVFDTVETEIVFDPADYSGVEAVAGENLPGIKAMFVPAEEMTEKKILEYADRLSEGNALLLEMKPRTGRLMWSSSADAAVSFGLSDSSQVAMDMPRIVQELKANEEKDIYLAAQISCCVDDSFASRSTTVALRTAYGANYTSEEGTWLDPYNSEVRNYVVQLANELFAMGFDEVVLADVMHPVREKDEDEEETEEQGFFVYTREMSTPPGPVTAVCGFATYVADQLSERSGRLSIYCNSRIALARTDESNGQDAALFMKIYDRVYFPTDKYTYSYNVSDIESDVTIGSVYDRLVPVVINYLPNNSSWVYIEQEEEED